MERQYELVLLGATGYTGKLCAEHIAQHLPTDLNWAIAGRNEKKLKAIAEELKEINSDRIQPDIEVANLNERDLDALAKKTKLLITSVGPYMFYGEPALKACASNGTHYIDCTGESPWVKSMIEKYHDTAKKTGAIMIPQCGVDSVPPDITVWLLSNYMRKQLQTGISTTTLALMKLDSKPSGGTLLTVLSVLDTYTLSQVSSAMKPYALSPIQPSTSQLKPKDAPKKNLLGIVKHEHLGIMAASPQGGIDTTIVNRSWGLLQQDSAEQEQYGPNFAYSEHMRVNSTVRGAIQNIFLGVGFMALVLPPVRWLIKKLVFQPGEGPDKESCKNDFAHWRGIATADSPKKEKAVADFSYHGSMYTLTGVTMAEAAMVLLRGGEAEAKKMGGGILTSATLGMEYVERLRKVGVELEVKDM